MAGITGVTRLNNEAANGFVLGVENTPKNIPGSTNSYLNTTTITIAVPTVDICLVGGGGAGNNMSGGGGGGMVLAPAYPITPGPFTVTIGAGTTSNDGGPTTFGSLLTALGGGAGQGAEPYQPAVGNPGGSGGGVGRGNRSGSGGTGIQTTSPAIPADSRTYGYGFSAGGAGYQGASGGGGAGAESNYAPNQGSSPGGAGKDVSPLFGSAPAPYYPQGTSTFSVGGNGRAGPAREGTDGTGEGGSNNDNAGGDGIAILKTSAFIRLGGVWRLQVAYNARLDGNWPTS